MAVTECEANGRAFKASGMRALSTERAGRASGMRPPSVQRLKLLHKTRTIRAYDSAKTAAAWLVASAFVDNCRGDPAGIVVGRLFLPRSEVTRRRVLWQRDRRLERVAHDYSRDEVLL